MSGSAVLDKRMSRSFPEVASLQCRYELRSLTGVSLIIPRTKTKFGERSFAVAGSKSWNSLPDHVKAASLIGTFKSRLKTFLLGLSYSD